MAVQVRRNLLSKVIVICSGESSSAVGGQNGFDNS